MNENSLLTISDLQFSYGEKQDVIGGVSFSVPKGEKIALAGPNGAGKTTLFLLLCGILKPSGGKILVDGQKILFGGFNPRINYLFQSPEDQLFSASIYDDVIFGPLNQGLSQKEAIKAAERALRITGCEELALRPPHHLSGGEKRMAAIATLLAMSPDVLLFDEPSSNLDARNRRRLIDVVGELEETMIVSSHDLEFLLETCTSLIVMDGGKIVSRGPIRKIMSDREFMEAHGLEKPHSLIPHSHYV